VTLETHGINNVATKFLRRTEGDDAMTEMIGRLKKVSLREVWPREPRDFTPWLADNIDLLNDAIGLSLSIVEREHRPAERLSVDLLGEAESGLVVIENQLGPSDHDHLGKLITYLTAIDAKVGIWIVADPKPEHINAISWLNESYSASFYLIKLEAIRIGDSLPAPMLTLIVGSSEESKEVGERKRELKEQQVLQHQFWTQLLNRAKDKTKLHDGISAWSRAYVWTPVANGLYLRYGIQKHTVDVKLYIDQGLVNADIDWEKNNDIFDALERAKREVEETFGDSLEWQRLDNNRACHIGKQITLGGYRDEERWEEIQDAMIDGMIRLDRAFRPHIENLSL